MNLCSFCLFQNHLVAHLHHDRAPVDLRANMLQTLQQEQESHAKKHPPLDADRGGVVYASVNHANTATSPKNKQTYLNVTCMYDLYV